MNPNRGRELGVKNLKGLYLLLLSAILLVAGGCSSTCSLSKENSKYFFKKPAETTGYSKMIFYNTSNPLLFPFNDGNINIKIDGEHLAKIAKKDFLEIYVKKGTHKLYLDHWDVFTFKNEYELNFMNDSSYIEVFAQPISTQFQVNKKLPEKFFEEFKKVCDGVN